jgi:hypothetical protein
MEEKELRQQLLSGHKTERIIFAATPETKAALEVVAKDRCMSVSALLTSLAVDEVIRDRGLFGKGL